MNKRSARAERTIAVHEAGHAVAHFFCHVPIRRVTIERTGDAGGHVASLRPLKAPPADTSTVSYLRWIERAEREITALDWDELQGVILRSLGIALETNPAPAG
jgi:hypothetical protein